MPDFRVEHRFDCSEDTYWGRLFFDEEYNRRLFLEYLKFSVFRETKRDERDGKVHRVVEAAPPVGDLPGPLKAVVGEGIGYEERGVFDPSRKTYTVEVVPNRLADKIHVKLELSTRPDGPDHCIRVAQGSVSAKIFGVGGLLEKRLIADLEKSYSKSAVFTNRFVAEKGLR
ncbi:MAG TPA: DUF2505 family protein [Polyangiaceae bacterium]|nr:DUF2505 family protein [Polyangiaceae bacterium]